MLNRFARKEGEKGFTLIELLIVMALLGVLVAVLLPKYQDLTPEAKIAATQQHLESLRSAVLLYTSKNYSTIYPPALDSLVTKGFIRKMPEVKISGMHHGADPAIFMLSHLGILRTVLGFEAVRVVVDSATTSSHAIAR